MGRPKAGKTSSLERQPDIFNSVFERGMFRAFRNATDPPGIMYWYLALIRGNNQKRDGLKPRAHFLRAVLALPGYAYLCEPIGQLARPTRLGIS
jgi:hypothetical protein